MLNKKYKYFLTSMEDVDGYGMFKTSCKCGDNNHIVDIYYDFKDPHAFITFYKDLFWWSEYSYKTYTIKEIFKDFFNGDFKEFWYKFSQTIRINGYYKRFITALELLLKGHITIQGSFIFNDNEHIEELIDVLKTINGNKLKED